MFTNEQIETIVTAQLYALLWSEGDIYGEDGEPTLESWLDYYTAYNATPELRAKLTEELAQLEDVEFYGASTHDSLLKAVDTYAEDSGHSWLSSFGHDLALTRNGHGAGFWDRGLGEAGDVLTEWAHSLGELHVFHGHDSIHPDKWAGMFHAE